MSALIEAHPETPVPIDTDIRVDGLKNPTFLVIIGFSTTKVLEAVKKSSKKEITNVLIIEPSLSIFHQTIKRSWIADLVKEEIVDLLVGIPPHEMGPHLHRIFTHADAKLGPRTSRCAQPEVICDPFAYPVDDPEAQKVVQEISKAVTDANRQVFLSMGCASDSFFRWEQTIRNEKNLQNSYRAQALYDKFQDTPVVVLGAGPSMQDFIQNYHEGELGKRALIIACDAALGKLLRHGIRPHLVTRCERKLTTIFDGVSRSETKDIYYAAYPWTPPEYFDLFERSFMLFRDNGVCRWTGYKPGAVNGGVSSANAALELAFLLGSKEIYLSGVDLCFLDGKSHVEGTEVEFDVEKSKPKWTEIEGNDGSKVTTIPVWYRCLQEYRGTIFKHAGKAEVFNLSQHGAKIEGAKVIGWEEAIDRIKHAEPKDTPLGRIEKYLDKHASGYADALQEKKKEAVQYLKSCAHDLKKLFLLMDDILLTARREEERVIGQLKTYMDPTEYFANVASIKKTLTTLYQEPARQVDQFKERHYSNELFNYLVLDTCQFDLFQTENKCHALKNLQELEHERIRLYVHAHIQLFRIYSYYIDRMLILMTQGPDMKVEYIQDAYDVPPEEHA